MNQPKISIVIPVYNGANYMRMAIDSALGQTYPCEVVVVNDGSRDDGATDEIARSYGDRIRYVHKENGGVATALNAGIEHMQGDYFCWLSHDDYYLPKKVEHQVQALQEYGADTILYGGYRLLFVRDKYSIPLNFLRTYSREDLDKPLFPVFRGLANGCTVMIHRGHFDRVGLFDPALPTTQDYDLWFRMFRGARVRYCDTRDVVMRQHELQGSRVIPSHAEEASRLWIKMDEQLFDYERAELFGTPRLFYSTTRAFLEDTPYEEAKRYYLERANGGSNRTESEQARGRLIETLTQNYEALAARYDARTQKDGARFGARIKRILEDFSIGRMRFLFKQLGWKGFLQKFVRVFRRR